MTSTVKFQSEAEVLERYDVVVAGGGFPGVCAAVAASRAGARVAILERDGTLGGQAAEIYTLGLDGFVDREGRLYAAGIPWEVLRRTVDEGQSDPLWDRVDYERMAREGLQEELGRLNPGGPVWDTAHLANMTYVNPNAFRYVLLRMVEEEKIDVYLEASLSGTIVDNGVVKGVVALGNYGPFALEAHVVVDTTPQAVVAALAGKVFPFSEVYMGTHPRVAGVRIERLIDYILEHPDDVELDLIGKPERQLLEGLVREQVPLLMRGFRLLRDKAIEDDPIYETTGYAKPDKGETPFLHFFYDRDGCGTYWIHSNPVRKQKLENIKALSEGIACYRKQQWLTHKMFRDYVPGFEKAHLMDTHPHIARALNTRGGEGGFTEFDIPWEHCQGGGDYYPDSVARVMGHPNFGQSPRGFQVPLRTLIPMALEGLLVIGKAACPTFHYSGTMATLGQAAGVIAALSALGGTPLRELVVSQVQAELRRQGAVVS
ncbi:MAG: FAD-dependent oxidoreductase [Armatimonadetes bacterium]|nr:FAD-dependent oxidoreductase [Armatimonadota bacterium]